MSLDKSPLTLLSISKILSVSVVTYVQINLCVVLMLPAIYCMIQGQWLLAIGLVTFLIALALFSTSTSSAWSQVDPILERSVCYSSRSVSASESLV